MSIPTAPMALLDDDEQDPRPADPKQVDQGKQAMAGLARAMTQAYLVIGSVIAGLAAGWGLDAWLGTSPRWVAIVPIIFMASTLLSLIRRKEPRE